MVDFSLSPAQSRLRQRVRSFAETVLRPASRHYDLSADWASDIYRQAWQEGFLQAAVPSVYGGAGLSELDQVIMSEELAWGCAGLYTTIIGNGLAITPLLLAGTEFQKRQWLPLLAERDCFASFALTEPGAGSDAGSIRTQARREGDEYVLDGHKCFCTSGAYAEFVCVFASTDPTRGSRGLSCFLVPRGTIGLRIGPNLDKLGHRASNQVELYFENARIPASQRLGKEGQGFQIAMQTLDKTRASVAAGAVGLAQACLDLALEFACKRVQFGAPIFANQGVSFLLADMAKKIEAARLLTWQAAWMWDHGLRNSKQSAMAKTFAADTAMEAATDALQILGGNGYSTHHLAEKFLRDAKLFQIYEGTNQIQRLVIAKELQQGN